MKIKTVHLINVQNGRNKIKLTINEKKKDFIPIKHKNGLNKFNITIKYKKLPLKKYLKI